MTGQFAAALAALDRLVNFFIPPDIMADREARKRAHVFLISHIFGPFIGNVVPGTLYFIDPTPGYDIAVLAISITGFWIFPFLLKARVPYNPLALCSVQNLIFCILWSCYFYGGVTSPTLAWVLTIPLLAFFYLGSSGSLRIIVIAMFVVNFSVFAGLYFGGYHPPKNDIPVGAIQLLGLVSTTAAAIYVAMMALYYAKVQSSQGELESEMRQHMATASALRLATSEAERAGAAKAEFLARMSHELRTPLNAVIGYSQILIEDASEEDDAESVEDLGKILRAGQHLLNLVNAILDLSKIEAGKMELDLRETPVADLLRNAVEHARAAAEANGTTIAFKVGADVGSPICDGAKLQDVLGHLIDNAVKATRRGRIDVVAERTRGATTDDLVIRISDTGTGLAPKQLAVLFDHFAAADESNIHRSRGAGLGLTLSQRLCRLMGGDIAVESAVGAGSCFTVRIPLIQGPVEMSVEPDDIVIASEPAVSLAPTLAHLLVRPAVER